MSGMPAELTKPKSTEGGRWVNVVKRQEGAPALLGSWFSRQQTNQKQGAPNSCYHAATPTAFTPPSTTTAWSTMPGYSFPPSWLCIWAYPNALTGT